MGPKKWLQRWTAWFTPTKYTSCSLGFFFFRKTQSTTLDRPSDMRKVRAFMSSNAASFHDLPTELILDITDCLALDALLALKLTTSRFNNIIRLDPARWQAPLSRCAQRAVQNYMKPSSPKPTHQYCVICNATYPISMFSSSNSSACVSNTLIGFHYDVVELPPNICSWHVGRFTRVVPTEAGGRNEWVSHTDKICMHCGDIQRWAGCACKCDSCSFWTVRTYTRYLNNDRECLKFLFWRERPKANEAAGQLWVRETCWNPGKSPQPMSRWKLTL